MVNNSLVYHQDYEESLGFILCQADHIHFEPTTLEAPGQLRLRLRLWRPSERRKCDCMRRRRTRKMRMALIQMMMQHDYACDEPREAERKQAERSGGGCGCGCSGRSSSACGICGGSPLVCASVRVCRSESHSRTGKRFTGEASESASRLRRQAAKWAGCERDSARDF